VVVLYIYTTLPTEEGRGLRGPFFSYLTMFMLKRKKRRGKGEKGEKRKEFRIF
jgi:hypothetical protein